MWIQSHPKYFSSLALKSKVIAGPGLPAPLTWQFDYGIASPSWAHECGVNCVTTKNVSITGPEKLVRYTFSTKYAESEGKLLKRETGVNAANILATETMDYQWSAAGLAYPAWVGSSPMMRTDGMSGKQVPQRSSTIVQNGRSFSWYVAAADFDKFARPLKTTRTSNLSGASQRVDKVEYHDDLGNWVLGQIKKRICYSTTATGTGCSNTTVAQTSYDPATALPLSRWSYGQLVQTLTWDTTSSLASGQRGTLKTLTDANNHTSELSNWYRGVARFIRYPATAEAPSGATRSAIVSPRGEITSVTDELGYATSYGYDPMGRLASITYPSGDSTSWTPTSRSFVKVNTPEFGIAAGHWRLTETTGTAVKDTYYDALWRPVLTRERDSSNSAVTRYIKRAFDAEGREIFVSYPSTSSNPNTGTWTSYDALGRVTSVSQDSELGVLTTTTQYLNGFSTRTTNPRGFQTTAYYQAFDQPTYDAPTSLSEPGGVTTTISRDVYGKPLSISRSGYWSGTYPSATRHFVYNAQQRLCKRVDPESGATLVDYDAAGNLLWSARSTSLTSTSACQTKSVPTYTRSTRTWDARNRLSGIVHPAGTANESYSYFADGALKTASTTDGGTWTYAYNKRRLPTNETLNLGSKTFAIGYGYNGLGHVSTLTYPSGLSVGFYPNAFGQPQQAGSYASSATYHPNGSLAGFNYGNGMIHSRTLNTRGLPSRIRDRKGNLSRLDYAYGYDKNGNVTSIADYTSPPYWNESRYLAYDARDRMTQATAPNIFDGELYDYDPLDNVRRMGVFPNGFGGYLQDYYYTYSTSNQRLDRINEANGNLEWDFDHNDLGETTSRTSSYLGATWNYQWNAAGRMVRAERTAPGNRVAYPLMPIAELSSRFASWLSPDGLRQNAPSAAQTTSETYVYDAHGHRTRSSRDDGSTRYQVYSRAGQLLYVEDAIDYKRVDYIYLGNKLVAQRSRPLYSSTATVTYHHTDAIQSANVETNTAGNQTERTIRMPYGAPYDGLYREGPGYAGHVTDTQTNLTYMQQRYYDPVALRFLSPDPVDVSASDGGNFNRYWYANNNPYKYRDPDGRTAIVATAIPVLVAVAGVTAIYVASLSPDQKQALANSIDSGFRKLFNDAASDTSASPSDVVIGDKVNGQLERGWSEEGVRDAAGGEASGTTVDNTGGKVGSAGEPASVYGSPEGGYIVVNDKTREVIRVAPSTETDPGWKPDPRIEWEQK